MRVRIDAIERLSIEKNRGATSIPTSSRIYATHLSVPCPANVGSWGRGGERFKEPEDTKWCSTYFRFLCTDNFSKMNKRGCTRLIKHRLMNIER